MHIRFIISVGSVTTLASCGSGQLATSGVVTSASIITTDNESGNAAAPSTSLTYHNFAADLMQRQCVSCHGAYPSGGAPPNLRLDSYLDIEGASGLKSAAARVALRVENGTMPPQGSGSMSQEDVARLVEWVRAGAPLGSAPTTNTSVGTSPTTNLTYFNFAKDLLDGQCANCHGVPPSPGSSSNMRLDSFDDRDGLAGVYSLRSRIAARIADKSMPPPATGSLSSEQLEKMQQWIAAGAPRGTAPQSPTTTPPSLTFGSPGAGGLTANTGATLSVQFSGISPNATWSAFYSSNLTASSGGTPIAENLKSSQTTLVWDTSSVPAGEYGIYAVLLDPPQNITVRATGTVIVSHPVASNTAPSVRVTQPNGGQVFLRGSSVNIAWSASDPDSGDLASMKYSVEYSGDAGQSWRILGSPSGTTSWSWFITQTEPLSTQGRIRVRASDGKGGVASDVSDGSFAITMPVIAAPTYADFDAIAQRTCSGGGCHSSGNKDYTSAQSTVTRDKNLIIDRISRDPSVSGYMPKGATLTPSEKETMLNYLKSL